MYLDVEGIVKEHFKWEVQDIAVGVDGRGPS